MIALRRTVERGVRHPVFGPLCLVLLALLLVFTVVHGAHDQIHEGELVACIAIVLTAVVGSFVAPPCLSGVVGRSSSRAPPIARFRHADRTPRLFNAAAFPLRL